MRKGYCELCKRDVPMQKKFSWVWFIAWCMLFGLGGLIYITYYVMKPTNTCPICGNKIKGKGKKFKALDNEVI